MFGGDSLVIKRKMRVKKSALPQPGGKQPLTIDVDSDQGGVPDTELI